MFWDLLLGKSNTTVCVRIRSNKPSNTVCYKAYICPIHGIFSLPIMWFNRTDNRTTYKHLTRFGI